MSFSSRTVVVLGTRTMAPRHIMDVDDLFPKIAFSPAGRLLAVEGTHRIRIYGILDGGCITI
jgi:hypothetical protein